MRGGLLRVVICQALVSVWFVVPASAANTVFQEGFEGLFPGATWTTGDADPAGTASTWQAVNAAFGGEGVHAGSWKGYCAGTAFGGSTASPVYQNSLQAYMQRNVDLTPYATAQLRFWHKIPGLELSYDSCRVLVDGAVLWSLSAVELNWVQVTLDLSAYTGGVHTLRFEFVSDGSIVAEGWYLDDIELVGYLPPPNDDFSDATTVVGLSGSVSGTTDDATKEANEPAHAGNTGGASVWYRWTPTQTGTVTFNTFGSGFDTLLAVYTGSSLDGLTLMSANDDYNGAANRASSVTFPATAGQVYRIAVDGFGGASGGTRLNWLYPQVNETILTTAVTNYTTLVIDSDAANPDPAYNRDAIRVRSEVRSVNTSSVDHYTQYTLSYRLLGPGDQPHPIFDINGGVNAARSLDITSVLQIPSLGTITNTNSAALRLAARLNPTATYRVELRIFRNGSAVGAPLADVAHGYYHFTNMVSGDAALNVIGVGSQGAWVRTSAVTTVPGRRHFSLDASYALIRYDNFGAPAASALVPVSLSYRLIDVSTGSAIPLKANQAAFTESLPSYQVPGSGPLLPAIQFFTHNLTVEPADGVQLDAVTKQYRLDFTVSHTDQTGQAPVVGNTIASADQRLLHFNGHLFFGNVDTVFSSLAADPPFVSSSASFVRSTLAVDNLSGSVVGSPNHVYGNGSVLSVLLRPNGNAELTSGNVTLGLNPPGLDVGTAAGIRFVRGTVTLSPSGGVADFLVQLPAGLGYTTDLTQKVLESSGLFPAVALNGSLLPLANPVFAAPVWVCEETKPLWIEVNSTTWEVATGRFVMTPSGAVEYVRRQEFDALVAAPVPAELKRKRSNEFYFRSVTAVTSGAVVVDTDEDGTAQLSAEFAFGPGGLAAHFPYDAHVRWTGAGTMRVNRDQVVPGASQLTGVDPVEVAYQRDCLLLDCPTPKAGPVTNRLDVSGTLGFTPDGGLAAQGSLEAPTELTWGYIHDLGRYAHRTEPVQLGGFLMAGVFLPGSTPVPLDDDRPGTLLLSGSDPADLTQAERPHDDPAYSEGLADYPGFNFRVTQHPGLQGESTLGGEPSGLYALTARAKYYVRWGGVSGIHEAVPGSFPQQMTIYQYPLNFSNFALSFLDSQNEESRTQGYVDLPLPADIQQNFQELRFGCLGSLEDAKVPKAEAGQYKLLGYWNADFVTQGIVFDRKNGLNCAAGEGWLVLAVKAHATRVEQPLYGKLGFKPDGNIISRFDNVLDDFDSRLKLPNTLTLNGPGDEEYRVTPVADAYFNTYGLPGAPAAQGFLNLVGKLDVPFFEDLQVHIHTAGKTNDTTTSQLPFRVMGGWPAEGFRKPNGESFFTVKNFDAPNAGFPSSTAAFGFADPVGNAQYESYPASALYHPRARRTWLEVVNFDYPLTWNDSSRSFRSFAQATNELLVVEAESQVKYLSAENAELAFGTQYDGLPTLNIVNLAFNALDDDTGAIQAFVDAGLGSQRQALADALHDMDVLLDPDLHSFFEAPITARVQPIIAVLYDDLKAKYQANPVNWPNDVSATVDAYFTGLGQNQFRNRFRTLMETAGSEEDVFSHLDADLARLSQGLGVVRSLITDTALAANLARELVNQLAAKLANSVADAKLLAALKNSEATTKEIDVTLSQMQQAIASLRAKLNDPNGDLRKELLALVASGGTGDAQIQAFLALAKEDVKSYLTSLGASFGNPFTSYPRTDLEGKIRQRIEDRFFSSPLPASIQTVFKHRFYDLDQSARSAIDSAFQQINVAVRDVINEGLAALDNEIRGLLGAVDKVMGAGRINGYAHIKGDSLNLLRLDAYAQMRLTSEMEFNAFFQIRELNSHGQGGVCSNLLGIDATEVTFGADGALTKWISSELALKAQGKFLFAAGNPIQPINLSGGIELDGTQEFETMTVKSLKASMGFGTLENYFSGATTVGLGGVEGTGGVFVGQVCDLAPIQMWDEDVPEVLGTPNPTFTGIYWYQEAWIPVSEVLFGIPATCFFRFDAGTGTGFYVFAEGPTFGGRMYMGCSGEALCLFSIKGTINLVGGKNPNGIAMQGKGKLTGKVGKCPFCKKFKKTVKVTYNNGDWDASY